MRAFRLLVLSALPGLIDMHTQLTMVADDINAGLIPRPRLQVAVVIKGGTAVKLP